MFCNNKSGQVEYHEYCWEQTDKIGVIHSKEIVNMSNTGNLTQNNVQFNGTLNVGYDLTYTYGTEAGKKFQLTNVKDVNYRTEQTPGDNKIENNHVYLYDKNGNLVYKNIISLK